jgi:TRAP-type C4-dicarboxylate transport system permease small subunit
MIPFEEHPAGPVGWSRLRPAVSGIERVSRIVAIIATICLTLVTAIDVVLRAVTNRGLPGAIEITEVVLVIAVFLGMMTASTDGMHITATLATDRLPAPAARVTRIVGGVVSIGIAGWVLYGTAMRAISSTLAGEYRFGLISVPVWPARVSIVIGVAGLFFALVLHLVDVIRSRNAEATP